MIVLIGKRQQKSKPVDNFDWYCEGERLHVIVGNNLTGWHWQVSWVKLKPMRKFLNKINVQHLELSSFIRQVFLHGLQTLLMCFSDRIRSAFDMHQYLGQVKINSSFSSGSFSKRRRFTIFTIFTISYLLINYGSLGKIINNYSTRSCRSELIANSTRLFWTYNYLKYFFIFVNLPLRI